MVFMDALFKMAEECGYKLTLNEDKHVQIARTPPSYC
jgi:hypothetical protein